MNRRQWLKWATAGAGAAWLPWLGTPVGSAPPVSPRPGSASLVRAYDVAGVAPALVREVAPYPGFTGGARVALADLLGDGSSELLTAPGPGMEPRAKAFHPATGAFLGDALVFDPAFTGGVFVGA